MQLVVKKIMGIRNTIFRSLIMNEDFLNPELKMIPSKRIKANVKAHGPPGWLLMVISLIPDWP
jgi:hypothetical protein